MSENSNLRIAVVGVIVLSLFSALFARLWYLQVMAGDKYTVEAESNRVRIVPHEAPRGRILDRRGRVLVDNRVSNVVTLSRLLAGDARDGVVRRLSPVLGVPVDELEERVNDVRYSAHRPIPLATDVAEETVIYLREHLEEFPGVKAEQLPIRVYPHGPLAAHVLGYVGEINDRELDERRAAGYRLGDLIGKTGVERAYERELRGSPGLEKLEVNAAGEVLRSLGIQPPEQGHDVQLTIDLDVQRAAEAALAERIAVARAGGFKAPGGSVVVLDPRDGAVVAMASNPTFDPTQFVHGISTDLWAALNDPASAFPLTNRAIQAQYAPGSVFKPITALAGITAGLITPGTTIRDDGSVEIGDRRFRNAGGRAYGTVDLRRALTVSSDVYFYKLGHDIWANFIGSPSLEIQRIARLFGLDETTGIELPFEADGRVPDPDWKRRVHEQNPTAFPEGQWFAGDNVNLAIGQGDLLVTPLQMADAYVALANGGTVFVPHLGARVLDRFGAVVSEVPAVQRGEVPLDPGVRAAMIRGMQGVITNSEGTASAAFAGFPSGWTVAGKTGTAQVRGKQDTSVFAAMMPAEAPRYVVFSIVEEGGNGSDTAAPIARAVLEAIVRAEEATDLPPALGPAPPSGVDATNAPAPATPVTVAVP